LVVEEVLGHLEAEKPTLLLCVAGRVERLNEEGRELVGQITDCAEHLFPPRTKSIKASPVLKDVFDDILRDLVELNTRVIAEQTRAIDTLTRALTSLQGLSLENMKKLEKDLVRDSGILEEQVHDLEREARQHRVDITECIGDRLEQITKLPERHIGQAGICASMAHEQAEAAVNQGYRRITAQVDPIEEYFGEIERCRARNPRDQEVCVAALQIGIQNDQIQIPSKIRLVVEEVLGHLEAEKPALLLCVAGRVERLNEEGRDLVLQISDCAEHLFPPRTQSIKA
jgi:uncharacterized protein (UPF0335 family)